MTDAKRLAEKIFMLMTGSEYRGASLPDVLKVSEIESLLAEALEEVKGVYLPIDKGSILGEELLRRAKAEAYEHAAQIAEKWENQCLNCADEIAASIRAEKPK